jgi:hypothetical protein
MRANIDAIPSTGAEALRQRPRQAITWSPARSIAGRAVHVVERQCREDGG